MPYTLLRTNGTVLTVVQDGTIDNSTSLTYVGKNYTGYGTPFNDNFVKLLENFSNSTSPITPLSGQFWFDSSSKKINLYDGNKFKSVGMVDYGTQLPVGMNPGDLHFNATTQTLYAFNGVQWLTIGPPPSATATNTTSIVDINDTVPAQHLAIQSAINTTTVTLLSADAAYAVQSTSPFFNNFPNIYPGINLPSVSTSGVSAYYNGSTYVGNLLWGTSASTLGMVDTGNNFIATSDFLRKSVVTTGTTTPFVILNDSGITIGVNRVVQLHVTNSLEANLSVINGQKLHFNLNTGSGTYTNIVTIDGSSGYSLYPNPALSVTLGTSTSSYGITYSKIVNVTSSTNSTSTVTGALIVTGGAGISRDLYVGGIIFGTVSGSITAATNLSGGAANRIPYQTSTSTTSFIVAPTTASTFLSWNGSGFTWTSGGAGGVSSFSGGSTGLTPATTSTGVITLGGTLTVANGGSGATTLTGYIYGNGTNAFTASATIPGSVITGNISGSAGSTPWSGLTGSAPNISIFTNNSGYITAAYLSSNNYATQGYVNGQGFITSGSLSGYATQAFVTSQGYITTPNWASPGTIGSSSPNSGAFTSVTATGNIIAYYSDKRLKSNIVVIKDALDKVSQISGVTFVANDLAAKYGYTDTKEQVGVIAQEIEKVLPQIVVPAPFDVATKTSVSGSTFTYSKSGENFKTVQYEKIIPLLIEAIKELKVQVEDLQTQLKSKS